MVLKRVFDLLFPSGLFVCLFVFAIFVVPEVEHADAEGTATL